MRIYLHGNMSKKLETFLPDTLWLSNKDCDDDTEPGENCICLEGLECECSSDDNLAWSCRWKGVTLTNEKECDEDFEKDFLINLIKERNLTVTNMSGYYSDTVEIEITSIMLLDGDWGTETYLDKELFSEKIEFIAD